MSVGTKWYKCDLHLHTPASKCFRDQTVTAAQWVEEALQKGLNCVAVTDHNTGAWIDQIKSAAEGTALTVFPGVELTCSDAKVHLLILFDTDKGRQDVEDFILKADIDRPSFGEQDAHSPKSVEDILKLALEHKAICIPAHIDEFNGISEMGNAPREKFLDNQNLMGVQVVHELMTKSVKEYDPAKPTNLEGLNRYYGLDEQKIKDKKWKVTEERMKDWRQSVLQAQTRSKAVMTFSDNPHAQGDSQHGIWGIGSRYTWIKMDQSPCLEGLRQALLLHKFRIKNDFECPNNQKPYKRPEVMILSVKIADTLISEPLVPMEVQFSPQMTTIIGGRGSGKSSLMQVIRGVFQKRHELDSLEIVKGDFDRFFRVPDKSTRFGILQNTCSFSVEIEREEVIYQLNYTRLQSGEKIELFKKNDSGQLELVPSYQDFLHLLDFEIYSQKQIYEVATNLNSLREKIDASDQQLLALKKQLEIKKDEYKQKSAEIRTLEHKVAHKGQLQADILDLENKISRYKENSLEEHIKKIQVFESEELTLQRYLKKLEENGQGFQELVDKLSQPALEKLLNPEAEWLPVFQPIIEEWNGVLVGVNSSIETAQKTYLTAIQKLKDDVEKSNWTRTKHQINEEFQKRKQLLAAAGFGEASKIEEFMTSRNTKQAELEDILEIEKQIVKERETRQKIKDDFFELRKKLTKRRQDFLKGLLEGRNVQAKVGRCRDFNDLEKQIRHQLGAWGTFPNDIRQLIEIWAEGDPEKINQIFNQHLSDIKSGSNRGNWDARFIAKVSSLNDESFDEFDLLFPEDDIQIEYKKSDGDWKPISTASAGQKTAAILTLILSQGKKPLLLDQPEDDLDNRLIYDLVVDQLRMSKESRQIIVVTHNANIPVNGDSEHIIVMDAESKYIKPQVCGCIEEPAIKHAIREIMEGGVEAFEMRSQRYKNL